HDLTTATFDSLTDDLFALRTLYRIITLVLWQVQRNTQTAFTGVTFRAVTLQTELDVGLSASMDRSVKLTLGCSISTVLLVEKVDNDNGGDDHQTNRNDRSFSLSGPHYAESFSTQP